jgi:Leucine-rich repeat (LRR) protein
LISRIRGRLLLLLRFIIPYRRSSWQGKIEKLRSLELCYSTVRDSQLARLTKLPYLLELNLDSCPVGDWALGHLADNGVTPNLQTLDLADTDVTDSGMIHIAKFKQLKHLSLFYCNISNNGLRHISKLEHLETLNLDSRDISDDGLRHLSQLKRLKSLDIFSGRITDSGCGHIAMIGASLETLELCGGGVGDLGCTLLAATLENLTSLNLSQNEKISNRGAAALAALSNLKALNLSNTRVNSSALRYFSGLTQLQSLALYGCRGIEDGVGVDTLQDGLPNLKCLRLNTSAAEEDGMMLDADPLDDADDSFDDLNITAAAASNMSHHDMDEDDDDEDEVYSDHD